LTPALCCGVSPSALGVGWVPQYKDIKLSECPNAGFEAGEEAGGEGI